MRGSSHIGIAETVDHARYLPPGDVGKRNSGLQTTPPIPPFTRIEGDPHEPRIKPFESTVQMGYFQSMKRLCLTCKNKGCVNFCRFKEQAAPAPKTVQLKG